MDWRDQTGAEIKLTGVAKDDGNFYTEFQRGGGTANDPFQKISNKVLIDISRLIKPLCAI